MKHPDATTQKRTRTTFRSTLDGDWIILIERDKFGDAPTEEHRVSITRKELRELYQQYIATPQTIQSFLRSTPEWTEKTLEEFVFRQRDSWKAMNRASYDLPGWIALKLPCDREIAEMMVRYFVTPEHRTRK